MPDLQLVDTAVASSKPTQTTLLQRRADVWSKMFVVNTSAFSMTPLLDYLVHGRFTHE